MPLTPFDLFDFLRHELRARALVNRLKCQPPLSMLDGHPAVKILKHDHALRARFVGHLIKLAFMHHRAVVA